MIIVLLLLFQSLCLYCQRLVLYIHDRWINPRNSRLLTEAAETSSAATRKLLLEQYRTGNLEPNKPPRKRYSTTACAEPDGGARGILGETCRFCANSPQGYCRHHFHLQELELQKTQQQQQQQQFHLLAKYRSHFWQPLCGGSNSSTTLEHTWAQRRQQRKVNREVKRNLKNRLSATTTQTQQNYIQEQQQYPMQKQYQVQRQYLRRQQYEEFMRARNAGNNSSSGSSSSSSSSPLWDTSTSNSSSGYQSPFASVYNVNDSLTDIDTSDSGLATSIENSENCGADELESVEDFEVELTATTKSTITTTYV
ncbi:uncharacterized protein LOC110117513 [Ceratitis capitata]|nr:uncharacterized protein LOC110117513 [Ceratitis capitata]